MFQSAVLVSVAAAIPFTVVKDTDAVSGATSPTSILLGSFANLTACEDSCSGKEC